MKTIAILIFTITAIIAADKSNIRVVSKSTANYNYSISWLNGRNDCIIITVRPVDIKEMPVHGVHVTNGVGDYLYFDNNKCEIGRILLSGFSETKTDDITKYENIVKSIKLYDNDKDEFYKIIESDILRLGLTSR